MRLFRVTVTRSTSGLVWAESEREARDFADDVDYEGDPDYCTDSSVVDASRLETEDLDSLPWGGPGHWTVRQLLAGEHEAPPPGPPGSLEPVTIGAWLALSSHRRAPLSYSGALDRGGTSLAYWTDGRGVFFAPGSDPLDKLASVPAETVEQLLTAPPPHRGSVAWPELDRVCREHVPDSDGPAVCVLFGDVTIDIAQLRRWAWGPASVNGEDVGVEWGRGTDPVRVRGAAWTAVIMPIRPGVEPPIAAMEVATVRPGETG